MVTYREERGDFSVVCFVKIFFNISNYYDINPMYTLCINWT